MKLFKRLGSVVLASAILVSSMGAFACGNDTFIGYDQIPNEFGNYAKLYKCPEKDAVVINGYAKEAKWVRAFYEAEFPHREIEVLTLDGKDTGKTRFIGNYADVNTKEVPEFWESKAPYNVYNRIYSDFTGAFKATNTLKTNYKTAPVEKEWKYKGFDKYVIENGKVMDYSVMYNKHADKLNVSDFDFADLYAKYLADVEKGVEPGTAAEIFFKKDAIRNISWLELTGPDYVSGGKDTFQPFAKIVEGSDPDWYDDVLVSENPDTVDNAPLHAFYKDEFVSEDLGLEWVTVGYEMAAPYKYIQILKIGGILMDGSEIEVAGVEVDKYEKAGEVKEYETAIQLIKKEKDLVDYDYEISNDYIVNPFGTEKTTTVEEAYKYEVSNNPLREHVENTLVTPDGEEYEVRIVKKVKEPGKTTLPYIYRYSGNANPKVEWKTAFAESAAPYEIYEEKFVDGKATGEYRTTGKYAEDMPSVSTKMSQPRVLTVMLSDTTDKSKLEWVLEDEGYDFIIAGDRVNVVVPAELYPGHDDFAEIEADIENLVKSLSVKVVDEKINL